jgi:hypothetical protein
MGSGRWWALVVIGAVVVVASGASQKKHDPLVSRIAFGSCSEQSDPQVFFSFFSFHFPFHSRTFLLLVLV